jgi:16S rRNA (guanine966-N2)-methyltransferase
MRIITGKFKGRQIETLRDNSIRPATDRVKGAIFNMLQNRLGLTGITVLDLFAGSGNLAFEALSRGAARAVFVDENPHAIDVVDANAERLGCMESCSLIQTDALAFIAAAREQFGLVFADPPYAYPKTPEIPELVFRHNLLKKDGFLIIEHDKHTGFEVAAHYRCSVQKDFGNTRVSFFVHPT